MPEITDKEVMDVIVLFGAFLLGWLIADRPLWLRNLIYKLKG